MTDYIKKWCINNNVLNRTIEMFWNCFDIYSKEEYEEYKLIFTSGKKDIQTKFDKVSFEVELPDFSHELVSITIDIYISETKVGWYKQFFLLNGEAFDDFFVIE